MRRMVLNRKTLMTHLCFGSPHKISTPKIFIQMIEWSKLIGFKCCLLQVTDDYCCVNNAGNCVYSLKYLVSLCCFAVVWRNYKSGILNTLSLFGRWQWRGGGGLIVVTKSDKVQRGFRIVDFSVTSFLVMAPNIFITHHLR